MKKALLSFFLLLLAFGFVMMLIAFWRVFTSPCGWESLRVNTNLVLIGSALSLAGAFGFVSLE